MSMPTAAKDFGETLEIDRPAICSFSPNSDCNGTPTVAQFPQIQLYDGSVHFVTTFRLVTGDPVENFRCLGVGSEVTGTEEFCQNHDCVPSATKFCFHQHNEVHFYMSSEGVKVPVQAWGLVKARYYDFKAKKDSVAVRDCSSCSAKCIQGGVQLALETSVGLAEVCSNPFCYQVSYPRESEVVYFPPEVLLKKHKVQVKIWMYGVKVRQFAVTCEAKPFCEMLNCIFCWEMVMNSHCAPTKVILMVMVGTILAVYFCITVLKVLKYFCTFLYYGFLCLKKCCQFAAWIGIQCRNCWVRRRFPRNRGLQDVEFGRPHGFRRRFRHLLAVITVAVQIGFAATCSEFSVLQAEQSSCNVLENGRMSCVLNHATRLSLVPQGQEACLLMSDAHGSPLGTLTLTVNQVYAECKKKSEFYTRSYDMKVESRKRCSHSGSCSDKKCAGITKDSKLDELTEGNDHPGFTHCQESCGCASCGCFYCTAACLFYRIYAVPRTSTVYEVYSCSAWELKVSVAVSLHLQKESKVKTHTFVLSPGIPVNWNGFKLTLVMLTKPTIPLLNKRFLTDETRAIMIESSPAGQKITGTIGQFQCSNRTAAVGFKGCTVPADSCICDTQEESVNCQCNSQNLEDLFQDKQALLPLKTSGIMIHHNEGKLQAQYGDYAAMEMQLQLNNVRLSSKVEINHCRIEASKLHGCCNCISGAMLDYKYTTDYGNALAHVVCGSERFSTNCTSNGASQSVTLSLDHANVELDCTIYCPAGQSTFNISGQLVYVNMVNKNQLSNFVTGTDNHKTATTWNLDFLKNLFPTGIVGKIVAVIVFILVVIIGIIILIWLCPLLCNTVCRRLLASKRLPAQQAHVKNV